MNESNPLNIHDCANQAPSPGQTTTLADTVSVGDTSNSRTAATMRCPACRAQQIWSPECRRCSADLTMLRQIDDTCHQRRLRALVALRDGRNHEATHHAVQLYQLRRDAESTKLLAVCLLVSGNFAQACRIAGTLES